MATPLPGAKFKPEFPRFALIWKSNFAKQSPRRDGALARKKSKQVDAFPPSLPTWQMQSTLTLLQCGASWSTATAHQAIASKLDAICSTECSIMRRERTSASRATPLSVDSMRPCFAPLACIGRTPMASGVSCLLMKRMLPRL